MFEVIDMIRSGLAVEVKMFHLDREHAEALVAEINKLKNSLEMWKTRAINLDGQYQNWIE